MATFKQALSYFGNANEGSMTVALSQLPIIDGDTVLLVWRVALAGGEPLAPATPSGWEHIATVNHWNQPVHHTEGGPGIGIMASAPVGDEPFRVSLVYRLDATGPLTDLTVALTDHMTGYALVYTLEPGEELGSFVGGTRLNLKMGDPVGLDDPSGAGQTQVLVGFDEFGLA